MGIGVAVGFAIYDVVVYGLADADWYRALFVGVFCVIVLTLFKSLKRWISR